MKVLKGSIAKCDCGTVMEYTAEDIVPAVVCPACHELVAVKPTARLSKTNQIDSANAVKSVDDMSFKEMHELIEKCGTGVFKVADIKTIVLKNGEKIRIQVAHRKEGLIFAFYDLWTNDGDGMAMDESGTTKNGYTGCDVRKFLNGDFIELLPDDLVQYLVPTKIKVGDDYVEDLVFIASETEVHGKLKHGKYEEGEQFELYKDWHNRVAGPANAECGYWYSLRTVASAEDFCLVTRDGTADYSGADDEIYLRPHFQIK